MMVEVDARQTSLEAFASPWPCHLHHPDDAEVDGSRACYFGLSTSAPASPPCILDALRTGGGGGGSSRGSSNRHCKACSANSNTSRNQAETSRSSPPPPTTRPKPTKANSAPQVLQSSSASHPREAKSSSGSPQPGKDSATASANVPGPTKQSPSLPFRLSPSSSQPTAPPSPPRSLKRTRAPHDVDGPGTAALSSKKRRLALRLVTSRLSRPYSLPATHIVQHRAAPFLKIAAVAAALGVGSGTGAGAGIGARKAMGVGLGVGGHAHQSALLVRKAAILNRVRIRRGIVVGAGMLAHGVQVVIGVGGTVGGGGSGLGMGTGARFPGRPVVGTGTGMSVGTGAGAGPMPLAWRPHTTAAGAGNGEILRREDGQLRNTETESSETEPIPSCPSTREVLGPPTPSNGDTGTASGVGEEEDDTAFPARNLDTGSDDDMDVYADFGVLFGPEGGGGSGQEEEEYFYEEYLDELDGIPWMA
ncbi:hypothetical protein F5B20DRAFT_2845 [Whalleya microplaca]|nr:hypothetical protein F5B20DRAFT_2845 [Whalleya microplaca]